MNNAQQLREQVSKEVEKQATKLRGYQTDLETVQKAADEAQGELCMHIPHYSPLIAPCDGRGSTTGVAEQSLSERREPTGVSSTVRFRLIFFGLIS